MQKPRPDATIWQVLKDYDVAPDSDWQNRLDCVLSAMVEATPGWAERCAARHALIERVKALDPKLALELDRAWGDQLFDAAERGGHLGYALARTWPTDLAGLDTWLDRAREYAGTGDWDTPPDGLVRV